jgi:DNA-binding NtrC family response regulator
MATAAVACGDKYLVTGVRPKYRQAKGAKTVASVLIYRNLAVRKGRAITDEDLVATLRKVGHKVQLADDAGSLKKSLTSSSKYDIVVADVDDSRVASETVDMASSKATVLPIIYRPTPDAEKALKMQYACMLKMPTAPNNIVSVIEETLRSCKKPRT